MQGKPDIRLVPSVVSGDPNDRRSIITAASIPAKKLGIKVPIPVSMALRMCPSLVIVRGDWEWYKQCSEGFIAICRSYSPVLQQFSIDECFIDMSLRCTRENAVAVATQLKDQVKSQLGFTVNVGIGSNKLLAKMASDFDKPDKVHTLWSEELAAIGMGSLTRLVGQNFAVQLHENANGRDDSPVETEVAEAKSYSAERTFPKDLVDPKDIDKALFNVACIVAHRIRRDDFRASCVSMFIKYKDFSVAQKQTTLDQPSDVTAIILNAARKMLMEVWDGVTPIRQVGLGVSRLTHESAVQMSLFEDPKMEYYREWDRQFDEDRARYEDAKMLAYERKVTKPEPFEERPPLPTVPPPEHYSKRNSGANTVNRQPKDDALVFTYPDGETALSAAKKAIKGHPTYRFHRQNLPDGTSCFEVVEGNKVLERHLVKK